MSIHYTTASSNHDLRGIIALQQKNLPANLSPEEIAGQGFVTVIHSLADLQKMNAIERHVIAKDGDKVVAYLLAMTTASQHDIPILVSMFGTFDQISYRHRPLSSYQYIVVGQVCVDKDYRGQGVLQATYEQYRSIFSPRYDFAITEIATRNTRSIRAHQKIGFTEAHRFTAPDGEEWSIVVWEW